MDINGTRGQIVVETGPGGGRKTATVIGYAQDIEKHTDKRVLAFTNTANTREGEDKPSIVANGGSSSYPAIRIDPIRPEQILEILDEEDKKRFVDVLILDEGNFYNYKLIHVLKRIVEQGLRCTVVAGLDKTFRGEPWEPMNTVIDMAYPHNVHLHQPYCKVQREGKQCNNLAIYSMRVRQDSPHKVRFYDQQGNLVTGFGFAPYFDPTYSPQRSKTELNPVDYTQACEDCFQIPRKDDVIEVQRALLEGREPRQVPDLENILDFLTGDERGNHKLFEKSEDKYVPMPHTLDIESGLYIPIR